MHENRRYGKKDRRGRTIDRRLPVLMWAEEGTRMRYSGPGGWHYEYSRAGNAKLAARHGAKYKLRKTRVRHSGIPRGRMKAYGFLERAAPQMFRSVEAGLLPDVEKAVVRIARRCGLL